MYIESMNAIKEENVSIDHTFEPNLKRRRLNSEEHNENYINKPTNFLSHMEQSFDTPVKMEPLDNVIKREASDEEEGTPDPNLMNKMASTTISVSASAKSDESFVLKELAHEQETLQQHDNDSFSASDKSPNMGSEHSIPKKHSRDKEYDEHHSSDNKHHKHKDHPKKDIEKKTWPNYESLKQEYTQLNKVWLFDKFSISRKRINKYN
ncbi:hypothetical protein RFI_23201 [Reticulomyxa filosa]|uniref:Uncharacterized protein n=1 Tax=Reticulomyxa filosa TaxID=46433 RepID=X6MM53_RETFI|nr:hypothetical protein RFI_23201 [Reticulomyxa filosa]|eukprot:ETO14170.1 hypothetical protein RFI_23201 [Reticulomyxa filosa]